MTAAHPLAARRPTAPSAPRVRPGPLVTVLAEALAHAYLRGLHAAEGDAPRRSYERAARDIARAFRRDAEAAVARALAP